MSLDAMKKDDSLLTRWVRMGLAGLGLVSAVAASSVGCLDRPVSPASPNTTNVFVQDIRQTTVDKIDLLFMIDNSISMADKQLILADAVPQLLNRLITPMCDDGAGNLSNPPCSGNAKPEFKAVVDIHIGIVSSSLGGHGGDQCSDTGPNSNPTQYDNAHLIGTVRPTAAPPLQSYNNMGFLWWDPTGTKGTAGPGEKDGPTMVANFTNHVKATGENGCGYEASLEAWYRFLVDPAPPSKMVKQGNDAVPEGVDNVVLQQRRDFLRPDSLVAVVMLTDENDCSIIDGGFNWYAAQTSLPNNAPFLLPRAAQICQTDPNSPCCRSCASNESGGPPAGCTALGDDAECKINGGYWADTDDHPNLRCWQQKKRFGIDFLYPTRRYVEALTQPRICPQWDANGPVNCQFDDPNQGNYRACNPLYAKDNSCPLIADEAGCKANANCGWNGAACTSVCETGTRDPALVYAAGIVGVPWQDIATAETLNDPNKLSYLSASKMTEAGRWDWLVPTCEKPATDKLPRPVGMCDKWNLKDQPDDALMIESSDPRQGNNPALNAALAPESAGLMANPINGHEWLNGKADLQYACIFKLPQAKDCANPSGGCDCDDVGTGYTANNPLCQGGGGYTKMQEYAKAFPGTRILQVLKDFGTNSIVASICPKITGDKNNPSYGYNPAVAAIIERLKEVLAGQCVNRPIAFPPGPDGKPDPAATPQCAIVEVQATTGGCGPCDATLNRSDVDAALVKPVINRLKETGQCTGDGCDPAKYCMCEIEFVKDRVKCEQTGADPNNYGWCYVDEAQKIGNAALVENCNPKRQLIFSGNNTPASGSTVFIACLGAPLANAGAN